MDSFAETPQEYSKQEQMLPRIHETNPIPGKRTQTERNSRLPWRSSPLERLQGKECLHRLAPKTPLVATEPVNEFIVEVHQTQVAEGDVSRGARRLSAILGCKCISAALGKDLLAGFGIRFAQRTRGLLASPF